MIVAALWAIQTRRYQPHNPSIIAPCLGPLGSTGCDVGLFVSRAGSEAGIAERLGLAKEVVPVKGTRVIGKADMVLNDWTPEIEVDPETYEVRADGELLTCEPATELPLAQRFFLF